MLKRVFIFLVFAGFGTAVYAQVPIFGWAGAMSNGQIVADHRGISITQDASGNVYSTGVYFGVFDIDPGIHTSYFLPADNAMYILKLDAAGNFIWAKSLGNAYKSYARSIAVDSSGNVIMTGWFNGTIDLDPSPAVYNITGTTVEDSWDLFVVKLDADGNFIWGKSLSGDQRKDPAAIVTDGSKNMYITGFFRGLVDFDPVHPGLHTADGGLGNSFLLKLDSNGAFIWMKDMFSGRGTTLSFYKNNLFLGGTDTVSAANKISSSIIQKLDTSGAVLFTKIIEADAGSSAVTVTPATDGGLLAAGVFAGSSTDLDPGPGSQIYNSATGNNYIIKLDALGNFAWATNTPAVIRHLAYDRSGSIYADGYFQGTVDFDPDPAATFNLSAPGDQNLYMQKLNPAGKLVSVYSVGPGYARPEGMFVDSTGYYYITGQFTGQIDFDPTAGVTSFSNPRFIASIFITKFGNLNASVLPLTLLSFEAAAVNKTSVLKWKTAAEINTAYFEIERSSNAVNYTTIGKVDAAGNTSINTPYGFTDKDPVDGINYYRLKMADKDGKSTYSKTLVLKFSSGADISVYPNPVRNSFQLSTANTVKSIQVLDNRGQLVQLLPGSPTNHYYIETLAAGVYVLKVNFGSSVKTIKISKLGLPEK